MNVFDEVINAISELRPLGLGFLSVVVGTWIYDLYAWWRVKHR